MEFIKTKRGDEEYMTLKELREKAKSLGLTGFWRMKKEELEQFIKTAEAKIRTMEKEELQKIIPADTEIIEYSDTEEWEDIRGNGIGGSDAGAVVGVNPYKSIIDVYIDKTQGSEFKGNKYTHWGHNLESVIFKEFQRLHDDFFCYEVPFTMKKGCLVANVDGMCCNEKGWGVVEIKTANAFAGKEWSGETIPDSYFAQVQHYLGVTGLDYAYIACLIGGNTYKEFYIERSNEDIQLIQEKCNDFWENNILKRIPPMPDGTEAYSKFLLSEADNSTDEVVEIEAIEDKAKEYKAVKTEIDELKKKKKLIEQEILKEMNENNCRKAIAGEYKFTIVSQNRKSINEKLMEKENAEFMEQYKKIESNYTVMKETKFLKVS